MFDFFYRIFFPSPFVSHDEFEKVIGPERWDHFSSLDKDGNNKISSDEIGQATADETSLKLAYELLKLLSDTSPFTQERDAYIEILRKQAEKSPYSISAYAYASAPKAIDLKEKAKDMARDLARNSATYGAYVKLKNLEKERNERVTIFHMDAYGPNGYEETTIDDQINQFNQRLDLSPDDPYYLVPSPNEELVYSGFSGSELDTLDHRHPRYDQTQTLGARWISGVYDYQPLYLSDPGYPQYRIRINSQKKEGIEENQYHELAHLGVHSAIERINPLANWINGSVFFGSDRKWVDEGFSNWISEAGVNDIFGIGLNGNFYLYHDVKLDDLEDRGFKPYYYRGYLAFKFIERRYGIEGVRNFIKAFMDGKSVEECIHISTNLSQKEFYEEEKAGVEKLARELYPVFYDENFHDSVAHLQRIAVGEEDKKSLLEHPEVASNLKEMAEKYPGAPFTSYYLMGVRSIKTAKGSSEFNIQLDGLNSYLAKEDTYQEAKKGLERYLTHATDKLFLDKPLDPSQFDNYFVQAYFIPWATPKLISALEMKEKDEALPIFRKVDDERKLLNRWFGYPPHCYSRYSLDNEPYLIYVTPWVDALTQSGGVREFFEDYKNEPLVVNPNKITDALDFLVKKGWVSKEEALRGLDELKYMIHEQEYLSLYNQSPDDFLSQDRLVESIDKLKGKLNFN